MLCKLGCRAVAGATPGSQIEKATNLAIDGFSILAEWTGREPYPWKPLNLLVLRLH
jgi:hypothetical protein